MFGGADNDAGEDFTADHRNMVYSTRSEALRGGSLFNGEQILG